MELHYIPFFLGKQQSQRKISKAYKQTGLAFGQLLSYHHQMHPLWQPSILKQVLSSKGNQKRNSIEPTFSSLLFRSNEIIWIATSYMLSYTALQPLCKYLGDRLSVIQYFPAFVPLNVHEQTERVELLIFNDSF